MRTIVVSDAHGYPEVIENALAHAGFQPGVDRFVYAGDFVDRGPDSLGCLELVERYATTVLVGNHELAVIVGFPLGEQTATSRGLRRRLLDHALDADAHAAWRAATCIDGVLVTHGGVSNGYQDVFTRECECDPGRLADHLNATFVAAVRQELETGRWDRAGILGDDGVFWFRPRPWSDLEPLRGVVQVTGHTPPDARLEAQGFYMVDSCVWMESDVTSRYRYAVVEEGRVRIEDGRLGRRGDSGRESHGSHGDDGFTGPEARRAA